MRGRRVLYYLWRKTLGALECRFVGHQYAVLRTTTDIWVYCRNCTWWEREPRSLAA